MTQSSTSANPQISCNFSVADVAFDAQGLVPCVVQSIHGDVRMLGYMNAESLALTLQTGRVRFYSRSRQKLWLKGETSGHFLTVKQLKLDCDKDSILAIAECEGPTCHRNTQSCFDTEDSAQPQPPANPHAFLTELEQILLRRKAAARLDGSYTEKLFAQGTDRIAKKVVEESGEVILAAKNVERDNSAENRALFAGEAADLLFHLELLLLHHGLTLADAVSVLRERHAERAPAAPANSLADSQPKAQR